MMLFSLNSTSGLENIQTNANPTSYPQLSDDGKVLAYINDGDSSSIYDSRAHFSTLTGGVYSTSCLLYTSIAKAPDGAYADGAARLRQLFPDTAQGFVGHAGLLSLIHIYPRCHSL